MVRGCLVLLLLCTTVRADDGSPWATGVPLALQERANALFAEGNALFAQQAHVAAVAKYKEALELWDHPLIRFNLAVALIRLDKLIEASAELDRALRYGQQPFDAAHHQQALDYKRMFDRRIVVQRSRGYVRAAWIIGGAGGAFALGGIGLGYFANVKYKREFENGNCMDSEPNPVCNADGLAATSDARTLGTIGTVVSITGAAAVVAAVMVYVIAPHDRVVVSLSPTADGAAIWATTSF